MTFGERLWAAMDRRGALCVGIDPHPSLLHDWGLDDDVAGLDRFAMSVVDALAGEVAVLKPQSAFFERHGSRGVAVLERTVAAARAAGALVLMDAKRGDIGSTVQAYADAYLDPASPLCADAVTAAPYLGFGSLSPLVDTALAHGNGVFVLALTSNPEGGEVQRAVGADGRTVAGTVLDHVRAVNARTPGWGSVGCVVGATIDPVDEDLDVGGPLLAPGLGAQGADPADLRRLFGNALTSVLPAVSRSVLAAGPDPAALRRAAESTLDAAVRGAGEGPSGRDQG
ncbi:orotidine-5'-phosphate decarboxylase [Haloactinopolyspora alba]|uniref:Orotidine 5'-phosphate decarboxylase n=1 Tax=Haloactinopolyspora alba TaxID=648780 RepID=A0A2P8E2B8_9ACTN|nr:orotidine-5'-phosphate decarboxylase [Haloactinopolyspora alba]PSL03621.1 orotidine-5'-phosphate decarboxylase [Haloactinopolyspora alba]